MPKENYTVIFTADEFQYILGTLKDNQEELSYHGYSYDFLNSLINKLDAILDKED